MKYTNSQQSIEFEIPDAWLEEAGADIYKLTLDSYKYPTDSVNPVVLMAFDQLQAPEREENVTWFIKDRMVSLLKGAVSECAIPPVEVHLKSNENTYRLRDGFHRFYMSIALGFSKLPVVVKPYFDFNEL